MADDHHQALNYSVQPLSFSICSAEFAEEGKLGFGFTAANELKAVDIGLGDRPRLTYISKKVEPEFRNQLVNLLKEFADCFA